MSKPAKLYVKLLTNPRQTLSVREFEPMILAFGVTLRRTRGSHKQYAHPRLPDLLTVTRDGSDALAYQVRVLLDMIDEFGLTIDR